MDKISADPNRITETQALRSAIGMSLWMFWGACLIASEAAYGFIHLLPAMAIAMAAIPEMQIRLHRRRARLSAATYRQQVASPIDLPAALKQVLTLREARQTE